ncbi:MAG TPA: lipid kinase [Gemmatimonadales bacterium]|nr:lipid kinase [Gemmatimonadales bacterium]
MPPRALLLINPAARRGNDAGQEAREILERSGLDLRVVTSFEPRQVADIIRREQPAIDRVIAAGGDGTLNAVLQGLVGTGLPLGILPVGTANNLARTLQLPTSLREAAEVAAGGSRRAIDLGSVNGHYYFTTASIGLSVRIAEELTPETKRRWGALAYGVTAFRTLTRTHPFTAEIRWAGGARHSRTIQIVVGNGRYYGSALPVAEDASIEDSRLDLYSLEVRHWWQVLTLAPSLARGRHGRKRSVEALRATAFEIRTPVPMDINADGEIRTQTPGTFKVMPRALEVFVSDGSR